jgi:hypothetical protein
LGRESFFGGQKSFQVQAYPFRMTAQNMAKHRGNPNMPFWKMLKQGNDHFEVTQLEPKVDVCEQQYVFNAEKGPNATRPPAFSPTGKCPVYHVADDIAQAVSEKQRKDEFATAELITRGTPSAVARKGVDGGMHALFAAKTPNGSTGHSEAKNYSFAAYSAVPPVPPTVNPPASTEASVAFAAAPNNSGGDYVSPSAPASPAATSAAPRSEQAKQSSASAPVRVAAAPSSNSEGFFSSLARKMGLGSSDTTASTSGTPAKSAPAPRPKPAAAKSHAPAKSSEPKSEAKVAAKPASTEPKERDTAMAGAQPVVPSNAFDSRWSLR